MGTQAVTGGCIDVSRARELAAGALEEQAGAVVYVDRLPREGVVAAGTTDVTVGRPALLVFRDEMPGANWMHPCTYALVDLETGDVMARVSGDRPPRFGHLPDTWVVAADPDGRADLLPPDHDPEEGR
jgi:hypothetical protein